MTEITNQTDPLPEPLERFVLAWGSLGNHWGVNRSVSQIHALLFVSEHPLTAEDIAGTLGMARSNVSNSLKELIAWNLIRRVPIRNDRRDHFEAETDVWEIVARVAAMRKEREVDPALATLRDCVTAARTDGTVPAVSTQRLEAMLELTDTADKWFMQMNALPRSTLKRLIGMGTKLVGLLPGRHRRKAGHNDTDDNG